MKQWLNLSKCSLLFNIVSPVINALLPSVLQRFDSHGIEALILILEKVLNCWCDLLSVWYCFPAKCFFSCRGTENSQMVPNQENVEGDQSHSQAQQPLQPQICVQEHCLGKQSTPFLRFPGYLRNVPVLLLQCGFIWKETMQLVSGKVSLLWHNSFLYPFHIAKCAVTPHWTPLSIHPLCCCYTPVCFHTECRISAFWRVRFKKRSKIEQKDIITPMHCLAFPSALFGAPFHIDNRTVANCGFWLEYASKTPLEVGADLPRWMRLFWLRCQIMRLRSVHIKPHYSQNAFDSALLAWYERGISQPMNFSAHPRSCLFHIFIVEIGMCGIWKPNHVL